MGELLDLFDVDEGQIVKAEYVELAAEESGGP